MNNFSELSLSPALQSNLARNKFVQPTPVQAASIPQQLAGQDLVITAQTGTGKTLAFLLPLIDRLLKLKQAPGTSALILTPTRELAMQISESFALLAHNTSLRSVAHATDSTRSGCTPKKTATARLRPIAPVIR